MSRLPRGAAFTLTAERCRQLALAREPILSFFARSGGVPPGLRADLDEMALIAQERDQIRVARERGSNPSSNLVRTFDAPAIPTQAVYIEMREACDLLQITEAAVRKALREGRLIGQQHGGRGCAWSIDLDSVDRLANQRDRTKKGRRAAC